MIVVHDIESLGYFLRDCGIKSAKIFPTKEMNNGSDQVYVLIDFQSFSNFNIEPVPKNIPDKEEK